jgi:hypothetical protein
LLSSTLEVSIVQYSVSDIVDARLIEIEAKLLGWLSGGDLGDRVPTVVDCATAAYELLAGGAGT